MDKSRRTLDSCDENIDSKYVIPASELKEEDINKLQMDLHDTKVKLRIITQKFAIVRKERDELKKENKELQDEIIILQNNMREMIPGFSNTSSIYPMYNELQTITSDFLKCNCDDIFFDVLSLELTMEGVVYFYKQTIEEIQKHIFNYFEPTFQEIKKSTCTNELNGPLLSVLKKVYQNSWKNVFSMCNYKEFCESQMKTICEKLQFGNNKTSMKFIKEYMEKLYEVIFLSKICVWRGVCGRGG